VKPKTFEHASDRLIEYLEEQAAEESIPDIPSTSTTEKDVEQKGYDVVKNDD
jgi:hypothetical protein